MKCTFSKFRQAGLVDFNSKISILMPRSSPSRIQGYPQDERRQRVREREREKKRERDQTGMCSRVWRRFIFYHSFYTLSSTFLGGGER